MTKRKTTKKRAVTHNRRSGDRTTQGDQVRSGVMGGAMVIGMITFLYFMREMLITNSNWAYFQTPKAWADVIGAIMSATVAFVGAWLGDRSKIMALLKGVGK